MALWFVQYDCFGSSEMLLHSPSDIAYGIHMGIICDSLGMPAVITMTANPTGETFDGVSLPEACRRLEEAGAAVVGLNCVRGPDTMLPLIKEVKAACKVSRDNHDVSW